MAENAYKMGPLLQILYNFFFLFNWHYVNITTHFDY